MIDISQYGIFGALLLLAFLLASKYYSKRSQQRDEEKLKQIHEARRQDQINTIRSEIAFEEEIKAKSATMPPPPSNPLDQ